VMYVSRQKPRLEAAKVDVLMPVLGLDVMTSRYDIICYDKTSTVYKTAFLDAS